jgi:hypothetical protein
VISSSLAPHSGPTAGGTPVRIYGTGFTGATSIGGSVKFGTNNATKVTVVDDTLITAIVPAASGGSAANNTFVDVSVTVPGTSGGTGTYDDGFYYTDATFTVSPSTGLTAGSAITTTLGGYVASTDVVVPEFNPLLVYVENFPDFPFGPPPYADILLFAKKTDTNGDATVSTNLANPFEGNTTYDANAVCPVNQTTANFLGNSPSIGLDKPAYSGKCMVANGQYGSGTLERAIGMTGDPAPAGATLVAPTSATKGSSISISGVNWNANPFFGSSNITTNYAGQTTVTAKICWNNRTACTEGFAGVNMTRYKYNNSTGVFAFSGANLHGGIAVGSTVPSPCTCEVVVTQNRPGGLGTPIVKSRPISITG